MKLRRPVLLLAALTLLLAAVPTRADIRLSIPEDLQPPVYTSSAGPFRDAAGSLFVITDGEWAAIPFWRPPACIPADFNLFHWVDLDAVECPLLVEGFAIWEGTEPVGAPAITETWGLGAVPVWFVRLEELEDASADGELTIDELAAMDSLIVGTASFYHEQNHTVTIHQVSHLTVVASGTLEDGRTFEVRAVEVAYELVYAEILFR
jgi:hypothetical protein